MQTDFSSQDDLFEYLNRPAFKPVRYRHLKRGTTYQVISMHEFAVHEFALEGSMHEFVHNGRLVQCEFQHSMETALNADDNEARYGGYAGPITIYMGESDGRYWMRPTYEFNDGRFERIS